MESLHHVLLLWFDIVGLCLPSLLLVSLSFYLGRQLNKQLIACHVAFPTFFKSDSMRYSRMLEESSFANRKADYFWLLFLSSLMLLVRKSFILTPSLILQIDGLFSFYALPSSIRAYPRSSTSPSFPLHSPTCRSTFGPVGTQRRPFRSSACSPSPRPTSPLRSSRSPGCSPARGVLRRVTSSGAQWDTWDGSSVTCGLARWSVGRLY
jgi:hypothetical protein